MKQYKDFWVFGGVTAGIVFLAISIFLFSVHFGEQTEDPDKYGFFGWFAMIGLILLSPLSGYAAVKILCNRKTYE